MKSKIKKDKKKSKKTNKKLKIGKIIGILLLIIALAISSGFVVYTFLKSKDPFTDKKNKAIVSIGIFEDGTYYIAKADSNIKFAIKSDNNNSYKLTDKNKKTIASKVVKENGKNYIKSDNKYKEGETYILELTDTKFDDKVLKNTKKIEFRIAEKEKKEYKYSDKVIQINNKNIIPQSDNKIKINNVKVKDGQIILIKENNDINNAYKIKSIDGDIATVESPNASEIYDKLNLYMEKVINFEDEKIIFNKDTEDKIIKEVKKSSFYKFLAYDVYAEEKEEDKAPKVSFIIDGDKLKIEIKITLKPNGDKKLGIEALKKHELEFIFSQTFSIKFGGKLDLGKEIAVDAQLSKTSSFNVVIKNGDEYIKGIEKISDEEYSKSIQEIVQKLQNEVPDVSENSVDIGAIEIPTGISGINVYMDIYFQCQFSLFLKFDYKLESSSIEHYGFIIDSNGSRAYRNHQQNSFNTSLDITGKEEIRVGLGFDIGLSIINKNIASAGIGVEGGAYQEAFSTFRLKYDSINNNVNKDLVFKFELGTYLKVKVEANINFILVKSNLKVDLDEIKTPVLTLGTDEIVSGIKSSKNTFVLQDGAKFMIPEFTKTILNLDTGVTRSEKIDIDLINFEDGTGKHYAKKNGYILLGKNEDEKIYAVYKEKNNIYKTLLSVYKSGTVLPSTYVGYDDSGPSNDNSIANGQVGSLSIDANSHAINAYKKYILDKKYISDYKDYMNNYGLYNTSIYNVGYSIYDIDKNGTPELILNASIDDYINEWFVNIVYTFDGTSVVMIEGIYNYLGIRYDLKTKEIVYTNVRSSSVTGGYGFYKLINNKFINTKYVGHDRGSFDVYTGEYEYDKHYYSDSGTSLKEITQAEEKAYFDNVVRFSYQDINNVR